MTIDFKDFQERSWRRRPFFFDRLLLHVPPELLDLERVGGLLPRLPARDVQCREAGGGASTLMEKRPSTELTGSGLEAPLRKLCVSVTVLNAHRHDPLCSEVLKHFLDRLPEIAGVRRSDIYRGTATLFFSSPGAVTAYHTDREQNFLANVRGTKVVHVFPRRENLFDEVLHACFGGRGGVHSRYRPEMEQGAQVFRMFPGTTLHIPRLCPHWVENGPEISASLSLNFFMPGDLAREEIYRTNDRLRGGLSRIAGRALRPS